MTITGLEARSGASGQAVVDAAMLVLERMGLTPADLLAAPAARPPAPTFAEYIPIVSALVSDGCRRAYGSYWNRVTQQWGSRRIDEPTPSEIRQLVQHVRAGVVPRRNSRGGRSAAEHLIAALRCLYKHAEEDGLIDPAGNPARKVDKPRRLPSTRRAVADTRLAEINHAAATTGDDPELDTLLLRLHTETACRRGGALALRPCDLDPDQCLVLLREKGETVRWQPVSPTLMAALLGHAEERNAPPDGHLLRYRNGRRITYRRYDHLWQRLGRHLPWVRAQQISMHWIRHTTLTWVEGRGVASDATFRSSREHALPAAQRAALRCPRPAGGRRACGDLGLHSPPGSDATMMQLIPLRGPHHRCTCWHRDAPGSSRLHRAHHRQAQRPAHGRHRSCEARAGLPHHWPRHAPDLATSRSGCT
jgi:integrase/recombinase XerC